MLLLLKPFAQRSFFSRYQHLRTLPNQKYEDAVNTLNQLQSNKMLPLSEKYCGLGLCVMKQFLERVHITDNDIKSLKIVHVAGTKGKGSTCAFVESILRHNGIKTGFCSSPHLVEVRDRICINGKPISRELFAMYFWKVFDLLDSSKQNYSIKMPSYTYFLTTMALYLFKHESVEAAVLEVGIGGAYDCTNVIKNPMVCGVASLGIDHVNVLGNSLSSIAWQKAGIFKKDVPAFTVEQPEEGSKVMHERAEEVGTYLNFVPDLSKYWHKAKIELSLQGKFQRINASLAVQLAYTWLGNGILATPLTLPQSFIDGLSNCKWNGRAQTLKFKNITFYLDGAHTKESISYASEWFNEEAAKEEKSLNKPCSKILCFNTTKNRNANYELLSNFIKSNFSGAVFTPNVATLVSTGFHDQTDMIHSSHCVMDNVYSHQDDWIKLISQDDLLSISNSFVFTSIAEAICYLSKDRDLSLYETAKTFVTESSSLNSLTDHYASNHLQILVTGSLYLVGGYLSILKPDLHD